MMNASEPGDVACGFAGTSGQSGPGAGEVGETEQDSGDHKADAHYGEVAFKQ